MKGVRMISGLSLLLAASVLANTQPVVSNVVAVQRLHTALVDVTYDVTDADGDAVHVTLWYSLDGGVSWDNECVTVSGDVGAGILPGTGLSTTWDAGADAVDLIDTQFSLRVYADDGGFDIWAEDFEQGCPAGWTLGGDWQCGAPTSGPGAAYGGLNCLATGLDGNYNNNQAWSTATATGPAIDLSSASAPLLSFRGWVDTEGSVYDAFNLKISTDGGTNFTLLSAVSPAYSLVVNGEPAWGGHLSTLGWQEFTADLSGYVGQTVLLQLAFRSDGSIIYPGVYVDDFLISD
jgi:hypothetical protein